MDDLAGLDWSKGSNSQKPTGANYTSNTTFSGLKPTPPASGRATPLNNVSSNPPSKPHTPANDSFANLVSWSASPANTTPSLQEQQKRLAELKSQQQAKQTKATQDQFGGVDDSFWNKLGSGRSTPAADNQKNGKPATTEVRPDDDDDMFAAFNAPNTSHPSPQKKTSIQSPAVTASQHTPAPEDDDDPFGLSEFQQREMKRAQTASTMAEDDDDVLGLLGKPVDPSRRPDLEDEPTKPADGAHPQDRAVAELVDMGFPVEKARRALETTESGTDLQAAISYLLNAAHQEGREASRNRDSGRNGHSNDVPMTGRGGRMSQGSRRHMEDDEGPVMQRRQQQQQQAEKDPSQLAAELGSNFLKSANTFWKQSTKRVQQAVQEFNSDSDTGGQPKWMREAEQPSHDRSQEGEPAERRRRRSSAGKRKEQDVTDEAMMLEGQRPTPPPRPAQRKQDARFDSSADTSRDHSPAVSSRLRETSSPQPAFMRQQQTKSPPQPATSRTTLNRQANEDQAAQAYVSSARRRRPAGPAAPVASEPDLFDSSSKATLPQRPASSRLAQPPPKASPIATRPPPPQRNIPSIPPLSLKASHTAREAGNAHFKRGDYSSAHDSYATSLKHIPSGHPLTLVLLTNHALTALKVGEPKLAISDCDTAIALIGVSKGESETVNFQDGSAAKPMRDYYGKALMRKAEALEQMEKWTDAALMWKEAVEAGHGGATSMQGRLRAEKAAKPASAAAATTTNSSASSKSNPNRGPAAVPTRARPRPAAVVPSGDSAAVTALRAANVAADRVDDEKFALADAVDARLTAWKNGKQDNLRALLGSLDTVLWEGAGWKKIGMADLVLPGKVKVQYMKGIGKVHPDKVSLRLPPLCVPLRAFCFGCIWGCFQTTCYFWLTTFCPGACIDPDRCDH